MDETGSPIRGVSVEVMNLEEKVLFRTETDDRGEFTIATLVPGFYQLRLEHPSFAESRQEIEWKGISLWREFTLHLPSWPQSMTVTATRVPQPTEAVPATIFVVSKEDLQRSPAVTVDDTLRQTPAFSLFRRSSSLVANPTTQGVSLRGVGPSGVSRTLVLWDGTPLNDPFGGWVYWSQLDKNSLERIEVSPGGGSNLYGSSALGGVIQLFSRASETTHFDLDLQGGSLSTAAGDLLVSYVKGPWSGNFSGSALRTDGYFIVSPKDRGLVDDRAASRHYALRSTAFYRPSQLSSFSFHIDHFAEDRDNGTLLQTNGTDITNLNAGYSHESTNGQRWQLNGHGLVERFRSNFTAISADRRQETLTLDQTVPSRSAGASLQWSQLLRSRHFFTAGIDWQWVRGNSEELSFVMGLPSRFRVAGGNQQLAGIYVQDLFSPSSRWLIQLGARLDGWTDYDAQRRDTLLSNGEQTLTTFVNQKRGAVNPKAGASYRLDENLSLRGTYYYSFRAPTLNELYRSFRVGNVLTLANDQLGPEKLKGFEGGLDWKTGPRLSGRLIGFWNELDNVVSNITLSATPSLITRQRENVGKIHAQGVEGEMALRLNRDWEFKGSYLLSDSKISEFPANPSLESKRLPQVPRHRVTVSLAYSHVRSLDAFLSGRFVGLQFDDDLNLFPLGNYPVVDFHVSRQILPALRLYFSVENLFNRHFVVARTPIENLGIPRLLHAGIKLTF